jgi:biopolymer transport protein ExbD
VATRFHAAKQRRAERSALMAGQDVNLVPLVDMFVSILFFVLLTYTGATAFLFSYTLELPPVLQTDQQTAGPDDIELDQLMTVRIENGGLSVERSAGNFRQTIAGLDSVHFEQLQAVLEEQRDSYPRRNQVVVIPSDETAYDHIIHVLERLKAAEYPLVAIGQRARASQVAAAGGQ